MARAALGVGASLVVALLSYHLFEKRFLALKKFFESDRSVQPLGFVSATRGWVPRGEPRERTERRALTSQVHSWMPSSLNSRLERSLARFHLATSYASAHVVTPMLFADAHA